MGEDTARLRQEIEATREDLSRDVDAVAFKASPQRIVNDRVDTAKGRARDLRDRVMGSAHDAASSVREHAGSAGGSASSGVHPGTDSLQGAGHTVKEKAEGNPLAAGLIAFGVGWLVSSLMPASRAEVRLVEQGQGMAQDHGLVDRVKEEARHVGQEVGEKLRPAAEQAAQSVKETATEAAATVKEEGTSAAQTVKQDATGQAQELKDSARQNASSGSSSGSSATPVYSETVDVTGTDVTTGRSGTV